MRKIFSLIILIFFGLVLSLPTAKAYQFAGAEYEVVENKIVNDLEFGIKHRTDIGQSDLINNALDFQQVNVLEVPASQNIKIVTWSKLSSTRWSLTPVRAMALDYEAKNPGYKVVAAINGDFFDIGGDEDLPFATEGIHVSNGENYKTTDNEKGSSREPIGFKNDGTRDALVGNVKYSRSEKMVLAIYNDKDEIIHEYTIDKVNQEVNDGEIGIFYGKWVDDVISPVEVANAMIVKKAEFALAYSDNDFYGKGIITDIGTATLGASDFAIVVKNTEVSNLLQKGVKVRAQYELTGAFNGVKEATGAGRPIIYQGEFKPDETDFGKARHPRTMVGIKEDGTIVMTVVDGRQDKMAGVRQEEMAAIMSYYGCEDAYNLDGGGSSTMLISIDGELVVTNSPSDNRERSDANCLLVVAKVPLVNFNFDIKANNIGVEVAITDYHGYTFTDLYVGINGEIKKVVNGKVAFESLDANTDYIMALYYLENDEYIPIFIKERLKTLKLVPDLNYLNIYKQNNNLILDFNYDDLNKAIQRNSININGKSYTIVNNKVTINNFSGDLKNLVLEFSYDIGDGTGRHDVTVENLKIRCGLDLYLNIATNHFKDKLADIFG